MQEDTSEWLQSCVNLMVYSLQHHRALFQEVFCHKFSGVQYDLSMLEMRNCDVVETTLLPEKLQHSGR